MEENCVGNFAVNGFAGPLPVLSRKEASVALIQATTTATSIVTTTTATDRNDDSELEQKQDTTHNPPIEAALSSLLQGNQRFKVHLFLSEMNRIAHHPTILQAVREALQTPYIALWSSDLNIKEPQSQQYYSAHQDATYTGLHPATQCLTVWVALSDPVGIEEGCLSFLRGSHKAGQLPHIEDNNFPGTTTDADDKKKTRNSTTSSEDKGINLLSRGQRVVWDTTTESSTGQQDDDWVAVPLRAGEATLHHFHTIHKSGYNHHPTQPRVGLALRYMAAGVQQTGLLRESITWIDYLDPDGSEDETSRRVTNEEKRTEMARCFDFEPVLPIHPSKEDLEVGRVAHLEAMRRESGNYFQDSAAVKSYDEKR